MLHCSVCGEKSKKGEKFCSHCGHLLTSKKLCEGCGTQLDTAAKFCKTCGKQVDNNTRIINIPPHKIARKAYIISIIVFAAFILSLIGFIVFKPSFHAKGDDQTLESTSELPESTAEFNQDITSETMPELQEGVLLQDGKYEYYIEQGGAIISKYSSQTMESDSEIPNELGGYPVTGIGDEAFSHSNISISTLPNTVTSIGERAFYKCVGIAQMSLPASITRIGKEAFSYSSSLELLAFTNDTVSTSELINIEDGAFANCALNSVVIPEGVTHIGAEAFANNFVPYSGTSSLREIEIPSSVTYIGRNAFSPAYYSRVNIKISTANKSFCMEDDALLSYDHTILYELYDKTVDGYSVPDSVITIMEGAFDNCVSCFIGIPSSVSYIAEGALNPTPRYDPFTFPSYDKSERINVELPADCKYYIITNNALFSSDGTLLHTLLINRDSYIVPKEVKRIGSEAFAGMGLSNGVTIYNGVLSIGDWAFRCCEFKNIVIPDSVSEIGEKAFEYTQQLYSITLPQNLRIISSGMFEWSSLRSIDIPDGVTQIGDSAFYMCHSLSSVIIPDSVTVIGDRAFYWCSSLRDKSFVLPNSLTEIGDQAFYNTHIGNVVFSEHLTTIGEQAFFGTKLTSVDIPGSVLYVGENVFAGCPLESVVIQNGLEVIGDGMFYDCDSLTSIILPDSIKRIGKSAFARTAIKTITLPENLVEIDDYAFYRCWGLREVVIPDSVRIIGSHAFSCLYLEKITIPESVTEIGEDAFTDNENLTIYTTKNSFAYEYANSHGIRCEIIDE